VSDPTRQTQQLATGDDGFSATVAAITSAFGDSTRRQIYLFARERDGVTATEVAEHFELHPNVARHHLEKLAAGGYLDVYVDRDNAGVGRPSKRYVAGVGNTTAAVPALRDDLLIALLGRLLAIVDPLEAEQIARDVGAQYGRSLAEQMAPGDVPRSLRSAMTAVAHALTAQGFAAHRGVAGSPNSIVRDHCPFGTAAIDHPVLCAADRGLVEGLLNGLCGDGVPVQLSSRARGDQVCSTVAISSASQ
jgi:predicted ArsR family transcriptional regulator